MRGSLPQEPVPYIFEPFRQLEDIFLCTEPDFKSQLSDAPKKQVPALGRIWSYLVPHIAPHQVHMLDPSKAIGVQTL